MGLFSPNTDFLTNYYDKARFVLAWRISLLFTLIFSFLSVLFILASASVVAFLIAFITAIISSLTLLYLKATKNYKSLFWIYAVSGTILSHAAINLVLDYTHYVDFLWMTACILVAFIGLGKNIGISFLVINFLGVVYFFIFTLNTHITTLLTKNSIEIFADLVEMSFAFFVIGYLLYIYMKFNDYSQMSLKQMNHELELQNQLISKSNDEKTVLVKEIHHRVKNNLQIIVSLLRLQITDASTEAKKDFEEAINRIMTMALMHKKLYQENNLTEINFKEYVEDLINELKVVFGVNNLKTTVYSSISFIGLKTIMPLGLLLNELISNSMKHAFKGDELKDIKIEISQNQNSINLKYSDSGTWKGSNKNGFGLELIETLTEQLEGNFERVNTTYIFNLKNIDE